MQQQRAGLELQQKVLCSTLRMQDALPCHYRSQAALHGPSQPRLMHGKLDNPAPHCVRLDPSARGFDFGKLRHWGKATGSRAEATEAAQLRWTSTQKAPGVPGPCDSVSPFDRRAGRAPPLRRGLRASRALLDLGLFVADVLAHERVVFLHFQLIGMQALVLRGDVEMPGSGRRQQLDLFAHGNSSSGAAGLNLHALRAQLGNDLVDALLFDGTQAVRGNAQGYPALLGFHPEPLRVQVRQEAAALLVVGVRDAVTNAWFLAGDFANAGHTNNLENSVTWGARA